jgi:hypothetical protein
MTMQPSTILFLAGLCAVSVFHLSTSRINQFYFFARTAASSFSGTPSALHITQRYKRTVLAGLAASILAFLALVFFMRLPVLSCFLIAVTVQVVNDCIAFSRAHRYAGVALACLPQDAIARDAESPESDRRIIAAPLLAMNASSRPALLAMLLPLCAAGVVWIASMTLLHVSFTALADAIDANGGAFLNGMGTGLLTASCGIFLLLRYAARSRTPLARFTVRSCVLLAWIGAAAIAATVLSISLHIAFTPNMKRVILAAICGFGVLRVLYAWTRTNLFTPPQVERNGDPFWRCGLFYCNPSDPAIFIQKRSGPGYTLNFANFPSWLLTLLLLGDIGFLFFIDLFHKVW